MIWYPYEQMKTMQEPYKVVGGQGAYLYTEGGRVIDSLSSQGSMIHGYRHPVLTQALIRQAEQLSHVMLEGLTHEPARKLADALERYLPGDLNYCVFSDSGSTAVEAALKMALQYYGNRGQTQRTKRLSLTHACPGNACKDMEAGDGEAYQFLSETYGESRNVIRIPAQIPALEEAFDRYHDSLSCFIAEPLLQAADGMRMYDVSFLERARQLCDQYDVLLIFDEATTGFGRTGNRFVSDLVLPDIIVLGKTLTGGYIGHGTAVANQKVYDGFYSDDPKKALRHGSDFMGNPLACSAALASMELFESEHYMDRIKRIARITEKEMEGFTDPRIREIRMMGGCICVEVKDREDLAGYQQFAYEHGVFSRPFSNYMYAMVPYIITEEQLVQVLTTMKAWFSR